MQRHNHKSKARSQQIHARRRGIERLGIYLNTDKLSKEIQENKLQFVDKQSNRVSIWRKKVENLDFVIVYDKTRKQIITVMPYAMYTNKSQTGEDNVKEENKETKTRKENKRKEVECLHENYKEHWLNGT